MTELNDLLEFLKHTPAMQSKQAIASALKYQAPQNIQCLQDLYALAGDDTAAIYQANQQQYLLHACEGMIPSFVEHHPYFAGWSAVMANVSDIAAMGGRATSIVNSFWHTNAETAQALIQGMQDACTTYGVPMVGGHTHINEHFQPALSVAIQGVAQNLLSVMHVQPKQKILIALNLDGKFHPNTTYWKCFEDIPAPILQSQLNILPQISDQKIAYACRDISNAGILGSLLMLLEASACGATIDLLKIPKPQHVDVDWQTWLQIFPSYGFLLTADEESCEEIIQRFAAEQISCAVIGETQSHSKVTVEWADQQALFWDFKQQLFTGLSYAALIKNVHTTKMIEERKVCLA